MLGFLGITSTLEARLALGAVLLAVIGGWMAYERLHLIDEGEARNQAKLLVSSQKLLEKAQQDIADLTKQHAADIAANEAKTNAALETVATLSGALDSRVRDFNTYRASHPSVASASGGPSAASPGECGAQGCGELAAELAVRGNELARSLGEVSASLQSAQRDRDSLTGLPK